MDGKDAAQNARTANAKTRNLRLNFMMCSPEERTRGYRKMLRPGGNGRVTEIATKDEVR